jgi:hypothetical protein
MKRILTLLLGIMITGIALKAQSDSVSYTHLTLPTTPYV